MKHSDSLVNLAPALAAAQAEMPAVGMDSKNPFLKNKYASLGAVIAAARPVLAKHGLAVVQLPISLDTRVGVDTILMHRSGEWLGETLFLDMIEEKGKSRAQVAGSIVTYLRRYAFAATLALYADEDDDGNGAGVQERGGFEPGGRFEDLPADRPKTSAPQQPATGQKPTAGPAAGPTTPVKTEHVMVAELRKRLGPNEAEFVRCLQTRAADKEGRVILPDGLGLDHIADAWAKYFLSDWDNQIAKVDLWCQQNPIETKPIEVPRDANIDCHSPDAPWRVFPMPWGEKKGTPLAKLEKKYLFGLWANVTVETTYKGQPKKPETIAADTKFREMLDEAGKHYEFHLK